MILIIVVGSRHPCEQRCILRAHLKSKAAHLRVPILVSSERRVRWMYMRSFNFENRCNYRVQWSRRRRQLQIVLAMRDPPTNHTVSYEEETLGKINYLKYHEVSLIGIMKFNFPCCIVPITGSCKCVFIKNNILLCFPFIEISCPTVRFNVSEQLKNPIIKHYRYQ